MRPGHGQAGFTLVEVMIALAILSLSLISMLVFSANNVARTLRVSSANVAVDLARFGIRQTTVALRRGSAEVLTDALWASALGAAANMGESRDLLVGLALPYVVAREVGVDPAGLFAAIAERIPGSSVAPTLVEFGSRRDVGLASFGWIRVETPDGPDFIPD